MMSAVVFQRILFEIIDEHAPSQLAMMVPDIYGDLAEYFNNDVIERWENNKEDDNAEEETDGAAG